MAKRLDDWERLLSAERHLQSLVPGSVLVGGTAAALHADHRVSLDGDHVLEDLRPRFDEVLTALEAAAGWQTGRTLRPVLIPGQLEGVLTGIRQLRRTQPLETERTDGLRVPTLAEMARIKVWLLTTRNTVRDYLDAVVLLERLGEENVPAALAEFDNLYAQPNGTSPLAEAVERLRAAKPKDLTEVDLNSYRQLKAPWTDWDYVVQRGQQWARALVRVVLEGPAGGNMTDLERLAASPALWNRDRLDLRSREILAQFLDRGTLEDWRALYRLAREGAGDPTRARDLQAALLEVLTTVPLPFPHFWLAALESLSGATLPTPDSPPYPAEAVV